MPVFHRWLLGATKDATTKAEPAKAVGWHWLFGLLGRVGLPFPEEHGTELLQSRPSGCRSVLSKHHQPGAQLRSSK